MREIIKGKLYDTEKSELLHSIEVSLTEYNETSKKIERLYRTNNTKNYFLCVLDLSSNPAKFVNQQVLDNNGWELFEITEAAAQTWTEKFLHTDDIIKIFDIVEM